MSRPRTSFEEFDWHLLVTVLLTSAVGLLFVWSTTHEEDSLGLLPRQLLFLGISLPVTALIVAQPPRRLLRWIWPAYGAICLVLVAQLFGAADEARGTRAWIPLVFGFKVQPSEFAKVVVVLAVADLLRRGRRLDRLVDLAAPAGVVAVPALLIAAQPDLGGAAVLLPVLAAMLFAAGVRSKLVWGSGLAIAVLAVSAYHSPLVRDYQRARVRAFFYSIPAETERLRELRAAGRHEEAREVAERLRAVKQGTNFQVYHSMISIGSGGWFGRGLGRGPHNRLGYLPERHNDFIFAVIGEETGLLGSTVVLCLHFVLILVLYSIASRTRDPFGRLLVVGVAALFTSQVFLNVGVALGLLPVTGVTLPFVSAGGSSMLAGYVAIGLVLSVGAHPVASLEGETYEEDGRSRAGAAHSERASADLALARARGDRYA